MEIVLGDGTPFTLDAPCYTLGNPKGFIEPIGYPTPYLKTIAIFTSLPLAREAIKSGFPDLNPWSIPTNEELKQLLHQYQKIGVNYVSINIGCEPGNHPSGFALIQTFLDAE